VTHREASWVEAADRIEDRFWRTGPASVTFSRAWWSLNELALHARPLYLVIDDRAGPCGIAPFMRVDGDTFESFVPTRLLARLLQDSPDPGAAEALAAAPAEALVCAAPFGFESPLQAAPAAWIDRVAELAEAEAARRGLGTVAFLYLEDRDDDACRALARRGYVTSVLDASAVIEIDPAWADLDGYFRAMPRGRDHRREQRRFAEAGYQIEWHRGAPDRVVAAAARLEAEHLQRKGHEFSGDELLAWYARVVETLGPRAVFVTASRGASDSIDAFVLFLDDDRRLVAKTGGFVRRDYLYFNVYFYEPVRHALAHGIRELEYGLAASEAKRSRGAHGRRLRGAFRTTDATLAAAWPRIADALGRRYRALWGEPGA
jgi:hypothetical protein